MTLKNEILEVSVKSEGAELTSIKCNEIEYLWNGKDYWKRQAPILFPIVGRLKDDITIIGGKEYHMGQHGFARDMEFSIFFNDDKKVTYLLKSSEETKKMYPYSFELYISYELKDNKIVVTYEIKNIDDKKMLFCIGGHPAFNWPLVKGEEFNDYYIEFEEKETQKFREIVGGCIKKTDKMILEDTNRIDLNKEIFSIDTFVLKDLKSKWVALKSKKNDRYVKVYFEGFPYIGIWSRADEAPFVCLEPWIGVADDIDATGRFEDKDCIVELDVDKTYKCSYIIEIK